MKQINLRSPAFISLLKYAVVAILAILIFNWFKGCSPESEKTKIQTVIVPEVKGSFEPKKPESKPIDQKPIVIKEKGETIYLDNPLNQKLLQENEKLKAEYSKMSDSLKSKAYDKAIQLNNFSTSFEDDALLLNIHGIVRGEVQEITPSYTIKERKLEVPIKETVFRLSLGGEIGTSIIEPKLIFKGNLILQNRKGNQFSGSFDTNNTVWAGYSHSIFHIKR